MWLLVLVHVYNGCAETSTWLEDEGVLTVLLRCVGGGKPQFVSLAFYHYNRATKLSVCFFCMINGKRFVLV